MGYKTVAQTATEKILSRVMGRPVKAGELIYPEPDLVTVHDWYTVNVHDALAELGVDKILRPDKLLICTDHEPIAVSKQAADRQAKVRWIAKHHGVGQFFDAGRGGHGHIFPMEMGLVKPGMFVFSYDPHVTNYGAVGCLGVSVVVEIVEVLAAGSAWLIVPETVQVRLKGRLSKGVSIRDVAQKLIAQMDPDIVDYTVVEFVGEALNDIDVDRRMTLVNTPLETGAKSALVEVDDVARRWFSERGIDASGAVNSDPNAVFKAVVEFDLGQLEPQVALPPTPDNVQGISTVQGRRIDHAFVGSCASSSLEDLRDTARILDGHQIAPWVRMLITPGTNEIAGRAAQQGLLEIFHKSGAIVTAPGCGPCAGGRIGPLASGEVSINTGTRNDYGRLGARDAEIYLASPMTVAASAIRGEITDPRQFL
jgi:3-isopropylmalate/(R)-2-methylmalate dehydratase large subunit